MTVNPDRYESMPYRRCGRSGLELPALALGMWHNFGGVDPYENARAMIRLAFDRGITYLDLANNYGPPPGSAERNVGRVLAEDLSAYRDELIIATKAGFPHWPGPYGKGGSRKYLLASLDKSLRRLGLDYVDIYYHHVPDKQTPIEESVGALVSAVQQGKALYAGISNYRTEPCREAVRLLREAGVPCLINQVPYNMLNRWVLEGEFIEYLEEAGVGCCTFSPLAQGLLTNRYLDGIPADSRAAKATGFLQADQVDEPTVTAVRALAMIADERGQTLAQMALAWNLRHQQVATVIIGASRPGQIEDSLGAVANLEWDQAHLDAIETICQQRTEALSTAV